MSTTYASPRSPTVRIPTRKRMSSDDFVRKQQMMQEEAMAEIRDYEMYHRIYASRRSHVQYQPLNESLREYKGLWREQLSLYQTSRFRGKLEDLHEEHHEGIFHLEL